MKIAFITMHAARNYGAVLQTYALQKVLNQWGTKALLLIIGGIIKNYLVIYFMSMRSFVKIYFKYCLCV